MTDLKNKVVVITGAAQGLGRALATEFYTQGCHLALIDIDINGLAKVKDAIDTTEQKVTIYEADVSSEENIARTRLAILADHHCVDILVNNAGISISQPFEKTDLTDYQRLFDVNFWGTIYCTKYFLPDLKTRNDGHIVNIISDFAIMGFPGKSAYGSSKSAVLGFTNTLKTELSDTRIKVCFVIPPPLDTGIVKNSAHIDETKRENEIEFLKKHAYPLDKTSRKIIKGIRKGKYRIVIGPMMFWIDVAARLFPTLLHKIIGATKKRFDFI